MLTDRLKRRRLRRLIVYLTVFASLIGSGVLFWALFFSPILRIQDISVVGAKTLDAELLKNIIEERLAGKKWGIFPERHFFFVRKTFLGAVLQEQFPKIASISFRRKWRSNILEARIREREALAVFCVAAKEERVPDSEESQAPCYFIDEKGVLYETAPRLEGNLLLRISDQSGRTLNLGKKALPEELMKFIKNLSEELRPRLILTSFTIEEESLAANYLRADTVEGWHLLVDTRQSPLDISNKIKTLLEKEIKEKEKFLEYIDLRVEGRAYYKLR